MAGRVVMCRALLLSFVSYCWVDGWAVCPLGGVGWGHATPRLVDRCLLSLKDIMEVTPTGTELHLSRTLLGTKDCDPHARIWERMVANANWK